MRRICQWKDTGCSAIQGDFIKSCYRANQAISNSQYNMTILKGIKKNYNLHNIKKARKDINDKYLDSRHTL
jgi:hypothetical protein